MDEKLKKQIRELLREELSIELSQSYDHFRKTNGIEIKLWLDRHCISHDFIWYD